jgi:hypothetical protein
MASVKILSQSEKERIKEKLEEFANKDKTGEDLTKYVFEEKVGDDEVEVRFFPRPEEGPVEDIRMTVKVDKNADWHEDMGSYRPESLTEGGPHYEALSDELNSVVKDALGLSPNFVKKKGRGVFADHLEV